MFTSSREYREYMTKNSNDIIRYNQVASCYQCSSYISKKVDHPVNNVMRTLNVPYHYNDIMDKTVPAGYETNEIKNEYLERMKNDATYIS